MLVGAAAMAGGLALAFAIAWAAGWIDRSGQPGSATSSAAETGGARPADWFETYEDAFLSDGVTQYTTGPANKRSDKPNYYVNLEPGTEYRWNVAACNTSGCSKYTERLYFRTP
jgi:hypothetical protein